jgi:hypothetical protein
MWTVCLCKHAINTLGFVWYLIWKKHGAIIFFASMLKSRKPFHAVSYFWGRGVGFECYICLISSLHIDVASYWEKSYSCLTAYVQNECLLKFLIMILRLHLFLIVH